MSNGARWTVLLMAQIIPWAAQAKPMHHHAQQHLALDARMYGMWTLDAKHSVFGGPYPPPINGMVNWTPSGWSFALALPDGGLYTDAVYTDGGCSLVGAPATWGCSVEALSPTHVRLIIRDGPHVERTAEIELIDNDSQRTVHRVTPSKGARYTETTIWKRSKS